VHLSVKLPGTSLLVKLKLSIQHRKTCVDPPCFPLHLSKQCAKGRFIYTKIHRPEPRPPLAHFCLSVSIAGPPACPAKKKSAPSQPLAQFMHAREADKSLRMR
jgi:hypothetical protein